MLSLVIPSLLVSCFGAFASALTSATECPIHNITRFDHLKVENLAVRSNGLILATIAAPSALLLQIDPLGIVPPTTILEFPGAKGAFGIAEGLDDVFYITTGNFSVKTFQGDNFSVFEVNISKFATSPDGSHIQEAAIRKVAELPDARLVNGMTAANDGVMLVADSIAGMVWKVDVASGAVSLAAQDPTLSGPRPGVAGVNGIKVFNESLYYTNTGLRSIFKKPMFADGMTYDSPELVANHVFGDDFLVTKDAIYVASPADVLLRVIDGKQEVVAGTLNSTASGLVGPTALQFGRLVTDRSSLYVTTNGGVQATVKGTPGVPRIDLGIVCN